MRAQVGKVCLVWTVDLSVSSPGAPGTVRVWADIKVIWCWMSERLSTDWSSIILRKHWISLGHELMMKLVENERFDHHDYQKMTLSLWTDTSSYEQLWINMK